MNDVHDFVHTWEVKENSLLLKYYYFWYQPFVENGDSLSFCKLFWAVVCGPLMFAMWIFIGIVVGLAIPILWVCDQFEEKKAKHPRTPRQKAAKVAEKFGNGADHCSAFFQNHPMFAKVFKFTILGVPAIAVVTSAIYGLVRLIAFWHGNWNWGVFDWTIGILGTFAGLILIGSAIGYLIARTALGDLVYSILTGIGHFFWAIGRFFATGYYAVKYRTCPKIVVRK